MNDRLDKLRKLNEARKQGDQIHNIAFLVNLESNADWLLGCVEALQWIVEYERHWGSANVLRLKNDIQNMQQRARAALDKDE